MEADREQVLMLTQSLPLKKSDEKSVAIRELNLLFMEWMAESNVLIVMGMILIHQKINNDRNGGFPITQCVREKPFPCQKLFF